MEFIEIRKIQDLLNCQDLNSVNFINIYNSDISILKEFDKNKPEILERISKCFNLTYLCLASFDLSDLSFLSGLKKLKYLWLANNKITDINPLNDLIPNLLTLDLGHNQINDFSVLNQPNNIRNLTIKLGKNNNEVDFNNFMCLPYLTIYNHKNSNITETIIKYAENNKHLYQLFLSYLNLDVFLKLEKKNYFNKYKNKKLEYYRGYRNNDYYFNNEEISRETFLKLFKKINN